MHVWIDAVPLLIRSAGVKNYLYYWISYLRRAAGPGVIRTFPALNGFGPLNHDASVAGLTREELYAHYAETIPIGRILQPAEIEVIGPGHAVIMAHLDVGMTLRWVTRRYRLVVHVGIVNGAIAVDPDRRIGALLL